MKKSEMIDSIFANVKWSETSKVANKVRAMGKSKEYLRLVYDRYMKDQGNALFYATLIIF